MTAKCLLIYGGIIVSYFALRKIDIDFLFQLTKEDGLVEYTGAVFFLAASLIFLFLYLNSVKNENIFFGKRIKRNIYFGILSLLFFICFGEKISWGQRIFEWATPSVLTELNAQKKTNLHNLWLFQSRNIDGTKKSFLGLLLNMNRLFSIFWLIFCIIIPVINLFFKRFATLFYYIGIPIVPIWIGGLFITNYISFHLAIINLDTELISGLDEYKESVYAIFFTILAIHFTIKERNPISKD